MAGAESDPSGPVVPGARWVDGNDRFPDALTAGLMSSAAPAVLLIEGNVIADPDLLEELLRSHSDAPDAVLVSRLRLALTGRVGGFGRAFARWWEKRYGGAHGRDGTWSRNSWGVGGVCVSASREAFIASSTANGDTGATGPGELAIRLHEAHPARLTDRALGTLSMPGGFRSLVHAIEASGSRAAQMLGRHPGLGTCEPLGTFGEGRSAALIVRRGLLKMRMPALALLVADRIPGDRIPGKLWDVLRLHCFWTGVRRELRNGDRWRRLTRGTVILMYHAIGERGETPSRYLVGRRRFLWQMRWIRFRRRPLLSLEEYIAYRNRRELPPPGSVVVTFDDGYADNAHLAAPILRRLGIPATFFIISGRIESANDWDPPGSPLVGRPTMSWADLADLAADGVAIGAHTIVHPRLGALDRDRVERELRDSRADLEARLGVPVANVAYPFGDNTPETRKIARELGFASGCATEPGVNSPATPLYALHRLAPWGTRSLPKFALDLWLGRRVGTDPGGDDGTG